MPKPFVYYSSSYKIKHAENNNHVEQQICRTIHSTLHEFMAILFYFFQFHHATTMVSILNRFQLNWQ